MIDPLILCFAMFAVTCALLMAGFPVAFTLAGTALGFALFASALGVFPISLLTAFPQSVFGLMTNEVLVAVPLFIFMGVMLERSQIAQDLLENMGRLFGVLPGGLSISVCIVGALLAASTGIVGATVVTMGLMSLPTMLRRGYDKSLACGTIAASGTLGQIIPPSIVLVLLGDQLSAAFQNAQFQMGIFAPGTVSVNDLFAGALVPGLMLVGLYILYQIGLVILKPKVAPAIPKDDALALTGFAAFRQISGALFAPILLIVAVLGSILIGLASPTEAAGVGAIGATMLAGYRVEPARGRPILIAALCMAGLLALTAMFDLRARRVVVSAAEWTAIIAALALTAGLAWGIAVALIRTFGGRDKEGERILAAVCQSTMTIAAMVFTIIIGARLFSLVFIGLGGGDFVESFLKSLPGGTFSAVLTVMAVMFVMGFFLDFLEIVFIVVPIVAPILLKMEMADGSLMNPVWLGIMMAMNLQTSFLTPPFGLALFYLRGVAPAEIATGDIYRGIVPFVIIQVFALALLWFLPGMATWLPSVLYPG
jgi:tripartite ATP-independent transporter DctM subunit